jgi:hypothetical protein
MSYLSNPLDVGLMVFNIDNEIDCMHMMAPRTWHKLIGMQIYSNAFMTRLGQTISILFDVFA